MMSHSINDAWRHGLPSGEIVRGWVRPDRAVAEAEARRNEQREAALSKIPEQAQADASVDTYA